MDSEGSDDALHALASALSGSAALIGDVESDASADGRSPRRSRSRRGSGTPLQSPSATHYPPSPRLAAAAASLLDQNAPPPEALPPTSPLAQAPGGGSGAAGGMPRSPSGGSQSWRLGMTTRASVSSVSSDASVWAPSSDDLSTQLQHVGRRAVGLEARPAYVTRLLEKEQLVSGRSSLSSEGRLSTSSLSSAAANLRLSTSSMSDASIRSSFDYSGSETLMPSGMSGGWAGHTPWAQGASVQDTAEAAAAARSHASERMAVQAVAERQRQPPPDAGNFSALPVGVGRVSAMAAPFVPASADETGNGDGGDGAAAYDFVASEAPTTAPVPAGIVRRVESLANWPVTDYASRTLHISNVADAAVDVLLGRLAVFGELRGVAVAPGIVLATFFDLRHAMAAQWALDCDEESELFIAYSFPFDMDSNQGILIVFNVGAGASPEELAAAFGASGEVMDIRSSPKHESHRFVEFWDVRSAAHALETMTGQVMGGSVLKLEFSCPGGKWRSVMKRIGEIRGDATGSDDAAGNGRASAGVAGRPSRGRDSRDRAKRTVLSAALDAEASSMTTTRGSIGLPSAAAEPAEVPSRPTLPREGRRKRGDTLRDSNDRSRFVIDLDRVRKGEDRRTTVMVKNIPNKLTQEMLLDMLGPLKERLTFGYVPVDFQNNCNVGYAFLDLVDLDAVVALYERLHLSRWERYRSRKVCEICYARIQGKEDLTRHFRNSPLLSKEMSHRPLLFENGVVQPFE